MFRWPNIRACLAEDVGKVVGRYIAWKAAVECDAEMTKLWAGTKTSLDDVMNGPMTFNLPAKVTP